MRFGMSIGTHLGPLVTAPSYVRAHYSFKATRSRRDRESFRLVSGNGGDQIATDDPALIRLV